ncbi:hypothetical protein [Photobacterium iliopiscarium]|uniref:hypothetical protein n=1 Tax=Photobacterium iliopiscarium TaxID=56192 RepID=UPI001E2CD666|nr:hypothetical protein [Photobacterium iliopiscarium]MCD9467365.1 hypothetical protein [Photobacterium iliopiscarium]MCD9488744.1 hypothetical protein [Photobacterium iliopiscarium]MCF2245506.1 hypothetical protein [Photobacterium iliopiscarium]
MNNITIAPSQATITLTTDLLVTQVNAELTLQPLDLVKIKGSYSQFFAYFHAKLAPYIDGWVDMVNRDKTTLTNLNSDYGYFAFAHYLARQYDPTRWSEEVMVMTKGFINITDKKISFNAINIHHIYDYLMTELLDINNLKHQLRHLLITDNINYLYRNTPPCIHRYAVDDSKNIAKRIQQNICFLFMLYLKTIATTTQTMINSK